MDLDELQQLLRDLMQSIQQVMQSGEVLSDEFQGALAETLGNLVNRIDELRSQQGPADGLPPTPPNVGNIQEAMPSSNVEGFAYDDETGQLMVRFLGQHPNRNGPVYSYGGVPREIFDLFREGAVPARTNGRNQWGTWFRGKTPSIGASLYTLIKTRGYPYQRVA